MSRRRKAEKKTPKLTEKIGIEKETVETETIIMPPTADVVIKPPPPKLTTEQQKLKEILKTAPLKPNDLRKRYMYETWFPQYEEFVRKLAALAS